MRVVILGLSITSSWGNGHAVTYRALVRALTRRGHQVLFLERDKPWYAHNRDLPHPPFGRTELYGGLEELRDRFAGEVREADLVMVGSFVPEGIAAGGWVLDQARGLTAFYDIDTPVTLGKLERGECSYLAVRQIARYDLYLSFTGGPTLERLGREFGSPMARPLYCSVDPEQYFPEETELRWDLGYLGTYSLDRQPAVDRLLTHPARDWLEGRFTVAGPQYPADLDWPANVARIEHLPPPEHRRFYNAQRFTLNVTRADMIRAGWSPSVRLFEAAACGTPIISDWWEGLDQFFTPGREIFLPASPAEVLTILRKMPEEVRRTAGQAIRRRVFQTHTAEHRARELEAFVLERQTQVAGQRQAAGWSTAVSP
ncbi:MAG: glycosyltransferase [Candidatus Zixiibacteriota bacterium]|nr:MAG: glycosyltransferase [candidate division Zixibacteria bacterium]